MRILVLGASGMLGNAMVRVLSEKKEWDVFGTVRSSGVKRFFSPQVVGRLLAGVDVENHDALVKLFAQVQPDVVVNCIGLVKQLADAEDPLLAIPVNALLPHRLARLCGLVGARLIHMSTDCVFSGKKGGYRESDASDAEDLYGKSKFLGEVEAAAYSELKRYVGCAICELDPANRWLSHHRVALHRPGHVAGSLAPERLAHVTHDLLFSAAAIVEDVAQQHEAVDHAVVARERRRHARLLEAAGVDLALVP